MTALTVPARPEGDEALLRPLPWRRMAGVTWKQHRIALAGMAALLGALAVWLWIAGTSVHHAWTAATTCHPADSAACQDLGNAFNGTWNGMSIPTVLLLVVPALIGAFAGAPVLGRELETGTFRFTWTQGFDRWRWALAKLVALAVVLAGAGTAFGALVSWSYQPFSAAGNQELGLYGNTPFAVAFGLRTVTFPAWTLAAFAVGALAGMLIRRVVPAIVTTLAVYAGLAIAAAAFLRVHYLAPLVTSNPSVPGTAWINVRASRLDPEEIRDGLMRGDFYASNGVALDDVGVVGKTIRISIHVFGENRYTTTFIGAGGRVLARTADVNPAYTIQGSEKYVRARIQDSTGHYAWTQPVFVQDILR